MVPMARASATGAIAARGTAAIIAPRKNAKPCKPDSPAAIARNEAVRASRRFGRTLWRRWSGYHRQSRVKTKMHCVKLPGQRLAANVWPQTSGRKRLAARDFDRQVAEFQIRVAVLNGFTALGIPVIEAREYLRPQKGEPRGVSQFVQQSRRTCCANTFQMIFPHRRAVSRRS